MLVVSTGSLCLSPYLSRKNSYLCFHKSKLRFPEYIIFKFSRYTIYKALADNQNAQKDSPEMEALSLLEWPLVCQQVAGFCLTPMGVYTAQQAELQIGKTREESLVLQEQTCAAHKLTQTLDFSGVKDVNLIVNRAISGETCKVSQLCTVKQTLECAKRLKNQLNKSMADQSLIQIMDGLDVCDDLQEEIDRCLDFKRDAVLDSASQKLANIRAERKENMRRLDDTLKECARNLVEAGGIDTMTITTRRARLCVAVRASYKFLLAGGLILDESNTGATLYMEPQQAMHLNNMDIKLSGAERAEEANILRFLSHMVGTKAEKIRNLSHAITTLDLACARAKHAKWLGAVRPTQNDKVNMENIRHPLLLGAALEKGEGDLPVPIDIKVKDGVKVVIISGPNTGGKTVALKTLGISAVMVKAGMYIPSESMPDIPWFDRIFADVGDSQSLEENLSTFSGHIRRLRRIIEESNTDSLVLIDELGGGTDPSEGSSLAAALLKHLAKHVKLCLITTHSASLKTLPVHEQIENVFENASVEFNLETLKPTYRILWEIPGQSNALNIADSLGFDAGVLHRANHWLTKLTPSGLKNRQSDLMLQLKKQAQQEEEHANTAHSHLMDIQKLHHEICTEADDLDKRKVALKRREIALINKRITEAKCEMDKVILNFKQGFTQTQSASRLRSAQEEITSIINRYTALNKVKQETVYRMPCVGEKVFIRRLGKKPAMVVESADESGNILVQLGTMKMRVKTNELMFPTKPVVTQEPKRTGRVYEGWETGGIKYGTAVQTSRNTLDLRGLSVEDGILVVRNGILEREPGTVLYIVHGIGTGALKDAVLSYLRRDPNVEKFEDVNSGCTLVYLK